MVWTRALTVGAVVVAIGCGAWAYDRAGAVETLATPKPGGKSDRTYPKPPPIYTCVVRDWSKPLTPFRSRDGRSSIIADSIWICDLPGRSTSYGPEDVGNACICEAYSATWAGKVED